MTNKTLPLVLAAALGCGTAGRADAQRLVEVSYGLDRNVSSPEAQWDGWVNGTIEWLLPSGLGLGVGTDHQFEGASLRPSGHQGWAAYLTASYQLPDRTVSPFLRGGIGVGRAPCEGDTCTDGLYLRTSTGLRLRLTEAVGLSGELGLSRVSRPFGGAGVAFRF